MIHYITVDGVGNATVGNELRRLERESIDFKVHSLRRPRTTFFASPWAARLDRDTNYIYPLSALVVATALLLAPIRFGRRFWSAAWNALTGPRESHGLRLRAIGHLVVACAWAASLRGRRVDRIHSQWIHSCGTVGMYGAWLLDVPFSFTGHAADLFRERVALRDKIRRADRIVCISEFHRRFYLSEGARPEQLVVVYCGIDTSHFSPRHREGDGVFRIRSSGRLVEKKGFVDLIAACGLLRDRGVRFECTIAGSGPLEPSLRRQIENLGLSTQVRMTGQVLKQEYIPAFMHGGDVFCLPCVWASDGDVDGLPQMLMEAMACGLPAVSTNLVGIPDLIKDGETGLLVEPGDVEALAAALERLAGDPSLRRRLASAGRARVVEVFDLDHCHRPLFAIFRGATSEPDRRTRTAA